MRWIIVLSVTCLFGCRDEMPMAVYADGSEWEPVVPLSPGRVLPRDMDQRQWDQYVAQSGVLADRRVKTFTPTWTGFSVDPAGELSYYDFGAIVFLWNNEPTALVGTSDSGTFAIGNLPESIVPDSLIFSPSLVVDDGLQRAGALSIDPTDGSLDFYVSVPNTADGRVEIAGASFTASGNKGIPLGWLVMYPK